MGVFWWLTHCQSVLSYVMNNTKENKMAKDEYATCVWIEQVLTQAAKLAEQDGEYVMYDSTMNSVDRDYIRQALYQLRMREEA